MKTGLQFAECALLPKWDKYTYDRLDCQAFVEAVLKEIGVRIKKFGALPVGAFVYIWKETGEEEVGYKDGLGNCTHVGIYCGNDTVRDSTRSTKTGRNGVGTRSLKGFNRVTLFSGLDYSVTNSYNASIEKVMAIIDSIHNQLIDLEGTLNELFRG